MSKQLLSVENINTSYGESQVLFDVSLEVDEGEVVVLLGRNGAGKTTTLRSILGIQRPTSGTVSFRGEDITYLNMSKYADYGIKYVPEERRIFSKLTVIEHLLLAVDTSYRKKEAEFERVFDIFPPLKELRDRQAGNLSGGEQQMLAIARALVGPTELLLLDEPSEGLAPQIIQSIFDIISELKGDTTILLVEQNYRMASTVSDSYYIIDKGKIVSKGPMSVLDEDEELKEKYLGVV